MRHGDFQDITYYADFQYVISRLRYLYHDIYQLAEAKRKNNELIYEKAIIPENTDMTIFSQFVVI